MTSPSWLHWPSVAASLALALMCWPARPSRWRLATVLVPPNPPANVARRRHLPHPTVLTIPAASLLGGLVAGVGGALAAAMLGCLITQQVRAATRRRQARAEVAALLDAVGVIAAELRAGAHPANAAQAAASGTAAVHRVLNAVAIGARLGAQVPALLARHASGEPVIAAEVTRLAGCWALAERHGTALADLVDAVRVDLDARQRLAGQVGAQLAGPRATATVLAALPLLGIALGQGVGANPWHVLSATPAGQALMVLGAGLICAGVTWSGRIMAKAAP